MNYSPVPLHIPDGFLTIVVSLIFWLITILMVGLAVSKTNRSLGEKQVPIMGVSAWALGRDPGDDRCGRNSGLVIPGWWIIGHGRQYL